MKKCLTATVVVYYFDGKDYKIGKHYYYDTTDTNLELIKQTLELYETCIKGTTPIRIDVERDDHMNTLRQIRNKEMLDSGVLGDPNSPETRCKDCIHAQNMPLGICYLHTEPYDNARGYNGDAVCVEPNDFCSYGERRTK